MATLLNILTILNVCSVQFFGRFDLNTSLHQSIVPAVIVSKEIHVNSKKTLETFKSNHRASLSQKCVNSGTAIIAFISVNGHNFTIKPSADPFQNEFMLDRYKPLLGQVSVYSNPAFVLLQINATRNRTHFIFDWMKIPITSQLLLFDADETVYCPNIDLGPSSRISFDDPMMVLGKEMCQFNGVEKPGSSKKLDTNNRFVRLTAALPRSRRMSDCSLNLDHLNTNPELCMIHVLEKQINFTTIEPRQKPGYFILKLFNIIAHNVVNDLVISKLIPGFQWLTHGVIFDPYKLVLITKLEGVYFDSLLEPFDMNIWIALILANCLFFTAGCVGCKFKKKCKLLLWMISTILSQPDECLTMHLFIKKRWMNLSLVSSWFFSMFLLNELYQGDLYACLFNVRLPIQPNSLREILGSKLPLFTIGESCNSSNVTANHRKCSSTLLTLIIPDIVNMKEAHTNLKKLGNKVLNRSEFISGHSWLIALELAINSDKSRTNKKARITPNSFGIFASSKNIDEFNAAARIYFKEHILRETNDINPFISMTTWLTQRGLFARAFSSGIGRLTESGLVQRWRKHIRKEIVMVLTKTKFKSMQDLENDLVVDESIHEQLMRSPSANASYKWEGSGRLYSRFIIVPDKETMSASEVSVPFEVMKLPFQACLACISFSTAVFLIEFVAKKLTRRSKINKSTVKETINVSKVSKKPSRRDGFKKTCLAYVAFSTAVFLIDCVAKKLTRRPKINKSTVKETINVSKASKR
jgi:hypothetical protein